MIRDKINSWIVHADTFFLRQKQLDWRVGNAPDKVGEEF